MKFLFLLLATCSLSASTPAWLTDINKAENLAQESDRLIVLNFSGSDWCIPCIKLHKEIFESPAFQSYADSSLVLVNADFPRLKKNQLTKEQIKQNENLADQYNPHGIFPLTRLLDANGKLLKQWEGVPDNTPEQFMQK